MTAVGDYTLADLFTLPDLPCRADLIEMDSGTHRPVVAVHRRDEDTGAYTLTGIHHDRLRISVPYDIDIDLTAIDNR
ncbi:hypothetical protein AB0F09_27940 [Streptomyces olivaceus]|uniref:hypothetical protein n=1 Tax=Streptomyces olivaceus TaxID=47716 RepID=UPI003405C732